MTITLLVMFLLTTSLGYFLRSINLRHLKRHGAEVPPGFEGAVNKDLLRRTSAYTLEQSRVGLIESLLESLFLVIFLFGGLLGSYDRWIASFSGSFVASGILFFLGVSLLEFVLEIPFSLYTTFNIEKRYGFNATSKKLWLTDQIKSVAIGFVFLVALTGGALHIVRSFPRSWWLLVWAFFAFVTIFVMYISPYLIEPLFNKYEPLQAEGLEEEIRALLAKAGLRIGKVLQVDASRRSGHSNAYFTGIGRVKRIVLYDTLLEQMTHGEILAVLAHEVGHWKRGHIRKRLLMMEAVGLMVCYAGFRLVEWGGLPSLLGLKEASFAAQVVIVGFIGSLAAFPFVPLTNRLSRRHEREADDFACNLTGRPENMAGALIKLSCENLANLHPHPLYASFYYSHPPVVERVRRLKQSGSAEGGSTEGKSFSSELPRCRY